MSNLKHEMRRMFDERSGFRNVCEQDKLEDGLVEKIINFAMRNLYVFDNDPISIITVKSLKTKMKLFSLSTREQYLLDSSSVLICMKNKGSERRNDAYGRLLTMSLLYASKYYAVGFHPCSTLDYRLVEHELHIEEDKEIVSIICLGRFEDATYSTYIWQNNAPKSYMVTEL